MKHKRATTFRIVDNLRAPLPLLLAAVATLASSGTNAQAHLPSPASNQPDEVQLESAALRKQKLAELDQWLRRLVGRFRYHGKMLFPFVAEVRNGRPQKDYELMLFEGKGDCIGIGDGPGVHCMMDVKWPEITPRQITVPASPYSPAMILYGMDTNTLEIRYLQVNNKGLPEGALGSLNDTDTVKFITPCVNAIPTCRRIVRISAASTGKIEITLHTWTDYFKGDEPTVTITLLLERQ